MKDKISFSREYYKIRCMDCDWLGYHNNYEIDVCPKCGSDDLDTW